MRWDQSPTCDGLLEVEGSLRDLQHGWWFWCFSSASITIWFSAGFTPGFVFSFFFYFQLYEAGCMMVMIWCCNNVIIWQTRVFKSCIDTINNFECKISRNTLFCSIESFQSCFLFFFLLINLSVSYLFTFCRSIAWLALLFSSSKSSHNKNQSLLERLCRLI